MMVITKVSTRRFTLPFISVYCLLAKEKIPKKNYTISLTKINLNKHVFLKQRTAAGYLDGAKMALDVVVDLDVEEHATHEFIVKARCPFVLDGEPLIVQMFQNLTYACAS